MWPGQQPAKAWEAAVSHRILIVDDNRSVRYYIRRWIEANTPCQVCGEAENGQVAVEMVTQLNPHIVILDFQMPVMNGLDAARQISSIAPNTAILMFTMHESDQLLRAAKAVGVKEVISKSDGNADHLLACLRGMGAAID
jgi:DNA-binding NarL/FixJ family response regulator